MFSLTSPTTRPLELYSIVYRKVNSIVNRKVYSIVNEQESVQHSERTGKCTAK